MSPSQASAASSEVLDMMLPSPISSGRSEPGSRRESRMSSPKALVKMENDKRRRSTRLSTEPKREDKEDGKRPYSATKKRKVMTTPVWASRGEAEFVEPAIDEPIMSVTGLPLDTPPTSKIKKESLWPTAKGRKGRSKYESASLTASTSSEPEDNRELTPEVGSEEYISVLNANLRTQLNEKIQKPSEIRSWRSLRPVPKAGASLYGKKFQAMEPPSTPTKKNEQKSKRKIKNASPMKKRENPFGYNDPMQLAGEKRDNAFDFADATKDNEDFCSSCGEPGIFLCCEGCPKSFHFACCSPPYDEDTLPEGEWFCTECYTRRHPPKAHKQGLFAKLLDQMDRHNPSQFRLPKKIRDRFDGVVTGAYGEYEVTDYKPFKPTKVGTLEQSDPELHYDKDGNALSCVKCGLTGISPNKAMGEVDKPIINCEYCPSTWHLDCLDPPLSTVKQLGTKWKCPNHADQLVPPKDRRLRKPQIVDVDQVRGFKNEGDIEIQLEDSDDENGLYHDLPTPPFFENEDSGDAITANVSKAQQKLWRDKYLVHRVPERGVVLDFLGKVKDQKELSKSLMIEETYKLAKESRKLLQSLAEEDYYNIEEKATIRSLVELKELDFQELLRVAGCELQTLEGSSRDTLTGEEIQELLHIKQLLTLKGREKVLKFLRE